MIDFCVIIVYTKMSLKYFFVFFIVLGFFLSVFSRVAKLVFREMVSNAGFVSDTVREMPLEV